MTRRWSVVEASVQVGVGYLVGVLLTATLLPWYGYARPSPRTAAGMGLWFAIASFARSYAVRRLFVRLEARGRVLGARTGMGLAQ